MFDMLHSHTETLSKARSKSKSKMKTFNFILITVLACGIYYIPCSLLSSVITDCPPIAPTVFAIASFSPVSNGPTYAIGLPPDTTISSLSPGTIYLSLQAPSTYQWAGLGIGSRMAGATIFMMYADGNGNVTISARDGGVGHIEPQFNSSLMAGVTLLEGSGIRGGIMQANIKCAYATFNMEVRPTDLGRYHLYSGFFS
jgi:hypothetical protein